MNSSTPNSPVDLEYLNSIATSFRREKDQVGLYLCAILEELITNSNSSSAHHCQVETSLLCQLAMARLGGKELFHSFCHVLQPVGASVFQEAERDMRLAERMEGW